MKKLHPQQKKDRDLLIKAIPDERFQMCFMYLYEEAKKRKWIQ